MKDSGIEWIGEIPEDWEVGPVKYFYTIQTGFTPLTQNEKYYDENGAIWVTIADITQCNKYIVDSKSKISNLYIEQYSPKETPVGSLLYSFKLSIGVTAFAGVPLYTNEAIASFINTEFVNLGFLYYSSFLILYNANTNIYGAKLLNQELIKNAPIVFPPIAEQQSIADYLDKKSAAVDRLMENQRMQIEKLKEYKQSVITEAVTKGIDKTVSIKYSENIYYPQIPSGWGIQKILSILSMPITDGPHTTPQLFEDGIAFVSAEAVSCGNGHIDFSHIRGYISVEFYNECCKKYVPQLDDIYMIKSGATTGKVCIVDTLNPTFTIWSPLAVLRSNKEKCYPKFLFYGLQSTNFQKQVAFNWSYGTQQNLGMRTLEQLLLPIPPISEQQQIAEYLDTKCAEIDKLISIKQQKIEKLTEYKKSLIYEYVTGKKQVG